MARTSVPTLSITIQSKKFSISVIALFDKPSDISQYPSHQLSTYKKKKKKKSKSDFRLIQSRNRLEINLVHSSVSNKIILPIGSKWCSKCRIWLHKETMRCHKNIVDDSICFLCCATHLHTPKRKEIVC